MTFISKIIEAAEKAAVQNFCSDGWDHNLIDANLFIAELRKIEEEEAK